MSTLMPGHAPLKFHPLANLFPMLSEAELADLGEDIKANGQAETVKLHRGMILDGRNRYTACGKFNLAVRTEQFDGTDRQALDWVVSKNLKRRHLTDKQRAFVAARIAELKLGDNQHTRQAAPIGGPTLDFGDQPAQQDPEPEANAASLSIGEAATVMSAPRRSVERAAAIEKATPELRAAVESGPISLDTGTVLAKLPEEEQREIVQMSEKDILAKAKEIRKEQNPKRRGERVEKLKTPAEAIPPLATTKKLPGDS